MVSQMGFRVVEADTRCGAIPTIHLVNFWVVGFKSMNGSATGNKFVSSNIKGISEGVVLLRSLLSSMDS